MKLSDYIQEEHATESSCEDSAGCEEERRRLRELLYEKMPGERIAKLLEDDRTKARFELSALLDQLLRANDFGPLSHDQKSQLIEQTLDMVLGLGPIEDMLKDDTITEITVNGPDSVFFEREGVLRQSTKRYDSEEQLRQVVDRIVSPLGRRVDEQCPIVNARLPQGHRVNVIIPPLCLNGTAVTIRKFRARSFTLEELVDLDSLTPEMAQLLAWAVLARKNIAVSGGTGGGKTTLLNALSHCIPFSERIITIEDSAELRFDEHPQVVRLEARLANAEGQGAVSIRELVINALRMRPDRIIVGECRGAEALDMLQAMSTGHAGSLTSLHANAPEEVIPRLVMMVRYGIDIPTQVIEEQIVSALDIIVQQDRLTGGKRRITQIAIRSDNAGTPDEARFTTVVSWNKRTNAYEWDRIPSWLDDLPFSNIATEGEVIAWRQSVHAC